MSAQKDYRRVEVALFQKGKGLEWDPLDGCRGSYQQWKSTKSR